MFSRIFALLLIVSLFTPVTAPLAQVTVPSPIPFGPPLRFERLAPEDGLSQNAVLALWQDHQGYLWIGTQDGLNRYDGYNFTIFKNNPLNDNSLSVSAILALSEDANGLLWIGTSGGGLNSYDPALGRFTRYRHDPQEPGSLSNDLVTSLRTDRQGRLWVGTCGGGLNLLDRRSGSFTRYQYDPDDPASLSSDYISTIFEDATGNLWIGTGCQGKEGAGLNRFDPQTGLVSRYQPGANDPHTLSSVNVSSIVQDAGGILWVGTGGYTQAGAGLNRLDPATGSVTRFQHNPNDPTSLGSNNIISLMLDSAGTLWIGTWGGGIDRVNLNSSLPLRFYHQVNNPYDPQSISSNMVWCFLEDRSGVIWVGTAHAGLNKLNPQVQRFALYRNTPGDPTSLGWNAVGPILEDAQGRVWLGTLGGGLESFDRQIGTFTHYRLPANDPQSTQANTYMDLYEGQDHLLWLGTLAGLGFFNPTTGRTTFYRHDPTDASSLRSNNVSAIVEDESGRLWVGTLIGLDWFDRDTRRFGHAQIPEMTSVSTLYLDQQGILWAGSRGQGLFRIDPGTLTGEQVQYTRFVSDPSDPTSLADDNIFSILQDRNGTLWLGTQKGLDRADLTDAADWVAGDTLSFTHYQEKDGLPNSTVRCLQQDEQGNLWISTNDGLARFDLVTQSWRTFHLQDGLQSNDFNSGACARAHAGELYFGGQAGFNVFQPSDIQINAVPPPMALTAFRVFNETRPVDLSGQTRITLPYTENFIAFEFVALDFHAPQKNRYAYKLENFDPDWVDAGTHRYASYTNLPGGNYIFRVKAANNDGVWNETGVAIPLRVTPPFWEELWFRGAVILALIGLLAVGVRLRIEFVHAYSRRLEGLVDQRTHELRQAKQEVEDHTYELAEANLRLLEEMEKRQEAEAVLTQKAAGEAVTAERNRLARDLHDAVTQTLFSASLLAEVLPRLWDINPAEARKRLAELREMTRGALAEMRTLLLELRPAALNNAALPDLLRQLTDAVTGRARLPVQLAVEGDCCLPPEVQVALYRIAQEALNNIVKYAKATRVSVDLRLQPTTVRLTIVDNGVGFDPELVPPNHLGLRIMRERAEGVGARFSLFSEPGEGTQVTVVWQNPN